MTTAFSLGVEVGYGVLAFLWCDTHWNTRDHGSIPRSGSKLLTHCDIKRVFANSVDLFSCFVWVFFSKNDKFQYEDFIKASLTQSDSERSWMAHVSILTY